MKTSVEVELEKGDFYRYSDLSKNKSGSYIKNYYIKTTKGYIHKAALDGILNVALSQLGILIDKDNNKDG